jgi:DNA-3-methyladenine glycosylase II
VRDPFRLDLTSDALRRLASNVVDVVAADGVLYRALRDEQGAALLAIRPHDRHSIEVRATGRYADRWVPVVARMLGTQVDLREWYARSRGIAWLRPVAAALRGLKPPRYPTLWEACAHAILFQQISIFAAGAIMRRAVEALGEPITAGGVRAIVFPPPQRWLEADQRVLRSAGLSANKVAHVRAVAAAFVGCSVDETELDALPTPEAAERLCRLQGVGPWSAALVLLRGLGRLDTFPERDSGVARSLTLVAGRQVDEPALLKKLGPARGMLYYHLLLARLRNLVAAADGRRGHD